MLDPATPDQGFDMMKAAFELSERYKTPVIVRPHHARVSCFRSSTLPRKRTPSPSPRRARARPALGHLLKRAFEGPWGNQRAPARDCRRLLDEPVLSAFNPIDERRVAGQLTHHGIVAGGVSAAVRSRPFVCSRSARASAAMQLPAYRFWQVGTPFRS